MKIKKYFYVIAFFLILSILLAGCGGNKLLVSFSDTLAGQESVTLEQFQENLDRAQELLASGVKPKGSLPVYDPASGAMDSTGDLATSGLYAVKLDPDVYGVSSYYVIPAGERSMTAEEYLQLAEASGLTGEEIVKPENAWLSFQEQSSPSVRSMKENRFLTQKERFWQEFLYYETVRYGGDTQDVVLPVTISVDISEPHAFFICPASEMDEASLKGYMTAYMHALPQETQKRIQPTEEKVTWEEAIAAAKAAMAEHAGRDDEPVKDYVKYDWKAGPGDTDISDWTVALYYADGGCYSIQVEGDTGEVEIINKMPDDIYNFDTPWVDRAPNENMAEMIYPQMIG